METFLLRVTGDLPGIGRFLAVAGGGLLALGAGAFLAERTRPGRWAARAAARFVTVLIAVLLVLMVLLSSAQILMRNVLDAGLLWIDPLLRHLVLVLAFAGAILATSARRHVQINVLGRLLKGTPARISGAVVAATGGTICVWLGYAGLQLLSEELAFGETVFLGIPAWGVALVFPSSFLAMAFQLFRLMFQELAGTAPSGTELPVEGPSVAIDGAFDPDGEPTG